MHRLYDMHCHLSAATSCTAIANEADRLGIAFLDMGVTPDADEGTSRTTGPRNVARACGLHPWWVEANEDGRRAARRAAELCGGARLVGEVGLDFSPARCRTRPAQIAAFADIVEACSQTDIPHRVLSLHAVRSSGTVLDILQTYGMTARAACVFHWFSGTGDEFARARDAGCFFSVNPRMLETRRGREFARQAPLDRLLLETDLPAPLEAPVAASDYACTLEAVLDGLAEIRRESRAELAERIAATSRALMRLEEGRRA